jgi:hypothetical protein
MTYSDLLAVCNPRLVLRLWRKRKDPIALTVTIDGVKATYLNTIFGEVRIIPADELSSVMMIADEKTLRDYMFSRQYHYYAQAIQEMNDWWDGKLIAGEGNGND